MRVIPVSLIHGSAGSPTYFTGRVWAEALAVTDRIEVHAYRISFEPGSRTAWHTHPGGQILMITSGVGWVQKRGETVRTVRPGDTVIISADEVHWHGASADMAMQYYAIQPRTAKGDVVWLEHVTDDEYLGARDSLFEPTLEAIGQEMQLAQPEDLEKITLTSFRAADVRSIEQFGAAETVSSIEEFLIPSVAGPMASRLYTPEHSKHDSLVVYFHGGGFVRGSLDTHHVMLSALTNRVGLPILSVGWPLAPEHRFPVPVHAAVAALQWATERSGIRIVAVAGDSAGGFIASSSVLASPENVLKLLRSVVLIHPMLDPEVEGESSERYSRGFGLTRDAMRWAWSQFVPLYRTTAAEDVFPLSSAQDQLSGWPATLFIQAELDPARSDGERLANRLRRVHVPVQFSLYPGTVHNFTLMGSAVDSATMAVDETASFLRNLL